ncbi:MAG: sigma 54-interacting transcriptional regulator [Deltaproteobacteria bacterium]|nr:sigma 54-interacting transcriptional regulator [Deltaproteobacteria bacterium]MBW1930502.1 sigma 54-interacting transcriptional regulator [Deltaproteobacteria bacterium]MBW2026630.1 sigma 54-interacting transcriptional regulator [Deltaproteobacteria bacterium]MBW2126415.1 sigma 54-interacting transcriptional regulator [Deltaproteobacteria bacterium]
MNRAKITEFDARFAKLLWESMGDGVFTLDSKGKITSWNPAMERITGYSADEAVGKSCSFLNFNRCFGRLCPTGLEECGIVKHDRNESTECFLRHKEGFDVPVVKCARVVRDDDGSIKGIVETVTDLTELKEARRKAEEAIRRLAEVHRFDRIIGKSHAMQQVFSAIQAAATSEATILLQGESGTGKELVAGAIHYNSSRANMPFVTVNCSALSESLLESELFGHIKGSFTGAIRDRVGRFEEANGGTIFLDEVGEITPFIQVKLLRVLQEREIERVGESKRRKIDIRIIAATNRNLFELVKRGEFREDLYYRLKVFPINIPPLRSRKEDIPLLVSHFVTVQNRKTGKHVRGLTQAAMRILLDYDWPGNVRELENAIEHAFVLCNDEYIDVFDLPVEIRQLRYQPYIHNETGRVAGTSATQKEKLSREKLIKVLLQSGWNKAEAARRVGLSRTAIWKYMKKWAIPLKKPDSKAAD